MPNTFAPSGFQQYSGNGSAPTYEQVTGFANYNASAIFFGDPVFQKSDGSVGVGTPGTDALAGVFVGCKYLSVSQKRTVWSNYWPGSDVASTQSVEVYYVNDPNARFRAQVGGSSSIGLVVADIGTNVQFAYGTGNTASGVSGAYIDITVTPTTTTTLPFRVIGLITNPPGAPGTEAGVYNLAVVAFNNVATKTLTGI
jgi:hypothetical protein